MAYEPYPYFNDNNNNTIKTPSPPPIISLTSSELWYWSPPRNNNNNSLSNKSTIKKTPFFQLQQNNRQPLSPLLILNHRSNSSNIKQLNNINNKQAQTPNTIAKKYIQITSYHQNEELGCPHYISNVALSSPCCNEFFVCRFCHDEKHQSTHKINRKSVNRLFCLLCTNIQFFDEKNPKNNETCKYCHVKFAQYFCQECRFYDNDINKEIFHCVKCGTCRIGHQQDFFHCDQCNCCLEKTLRDKHKCIPGGTLENSCCPVCTDEFCSSQEPITLFEICGHTMHTKCFQQYIQHKCTCPICSKTLGDVSQTNEMIDQLVQQYHASLPAEYSRFKAIIFCSDCELTSHVKHHPKYHKCLHCGSYNTRITGHERNI
jgi:RING finger/CHY zinc finger protein 1